MGQDSRHRLDPAAWLDKYGDQLFRQALVRVQRADVAEDLVQETLLAGLLGRESFRGDATELSWLRGILKHKIIDHFRRQTQQAVDDKAADPTQVLFDGAGRWARAPTAWDQGAEAVIGNMEFWNTLTRCLAGLPGSQAGVFVLREIDGYSSEEVCKTLGISPTNMWVRLHRARLRLRHCLEANWFGRAAGS
ncbi:MAG: sigma-70 family RNA polymerase sigma factor [Pseudomonadota bacterium]